MTRDRTLVKQTAVSDAMKTEGATTQTTWLRFARTQFCLRTLLILTTAIALFFWWYVQLPMGTITVRQAAKVRKLLSQEEIVGMLGEPAAKQSTPGGEVVWYYHVQKQPTLRFYVFFDGVHKTVTRHTDLAFALDPKWEAEVSK